MTGGKRKRVCVVGSGAAGMACAWSLGRFPDRFEVEVWEALPQPGGVATSQSLRSSKDGANLELNDQVQGGAPSYRNNVLFFQEFGCKTHSVMMKVCFGKGEFSWTNHADSALVQRLHKDIERFGRVLKWIHRFEPLFVFFPIHRVLSMWGFSKDFADHMVFPLTALFFGTGNQTPYVSAAIIARVFLDKELALFKYSPDRLLDGMPEMFAFSNLGQSYQAIASRIGASVLCNKAIAKVRRTRKGVTVTDTDGNVAEFDDIVFTCDTETTLRAMGDDASWFERRLLGNVRYYDDLIVTHEDESYMQAHYEMDPKLNDMYFIRTDPKNRKRVEMSFNLCHYQPHLAKAAGRNLYQTIFLDAKGKEHWTYDELDKKSVLMERWTHQFAHTWTHFAFWVPFIRFIQGSRGAWYAGAVTLVNTHEVAVMSGLAVAHRLGAPYPFAHDPLAFSQMKVYMSIVHGVRLRPQDCSSEGTSFAKGQTDGKGATGAPTQRAGQGQASG